MGGSGPWGSSGVSEMFVHSFVVDGVVVVNSCPPGLTPVHVPAPLQQGWSSDASAIV
jgi:hypothetical protein